jgi:hypothetical protein
VFATLGSDRTNLHMALVGLGSVRLLQSVIDHDSERGISLEIPEYGESGTYMVVASFDKLMGYLRLSNLVKAIRSRLRVDVGTSASSTALF